MKLSTKSLFKEVNLNGKVALNSEHPKELKGNSQALKYLRRLCLKENTSPCFWEATAAPLEMTPLNLIIFYQFSLLEK